LIGLGIDAVDIPRFRYLLARRPGLEERFFTPSERAYATRKADPAPSLAAGFAAKEAVMKALGVGIGAFAWHDVEVLHLDSGRPALVLSGAAAALASEQGVGKWRLSMTHTATLAEAVVAALP
jgi:holo-[acyl-carrier protein] synthase